MELVLTPENPRHVAPPLGQQFSTAMGELNFTAITNLAWIERTNVINRGPDGEVDLGNIDALTAEGDVYTVTGDWGEVRVQTPTPPSLTYW